MNKVEKISLEIIIFSVMGIICFGAMLYLEGPQHSISRYVNYETTDWLFKVWMFTLAVGAVRNKRLKHTFLPIMGLIMFDSDPTYPMANTLHDISAVFFFTITTVVFLLEPKSRMTGLFMLASYSLYFISLFYGELLTITIVYLHFIKRVTLLNTRFRVT